MDQRVLFRAIPGVDETKQCLVQSSPDLASCPRESLRTLIAAYWDRQRNKIREGHLQDPDELALAKHLPALLDVVHASLAPRLKKVINATGVVVHTNLGRSVLSADAREAVALAAAGYTNLELDLDTGQRGSRYSLVEELLQELTGAEAALVVNNNAAAVMLMLDTFCHGHEVIVSRGELVEIGGSFRIPAVMAKSGAILREVGATNRTHLEDYAEAIDETTRALMRVHTSNFRIVGFHQRVELAKLAELAHAHDLLLLEDLGSGSLIHFAEAGLPDEPTVQDAVAQGADLVCFSGDKVLGGPQAGIIVGKRALIAQMKKNQLTRALRCDKLCYAALEATLRSYRDPSKAKEQIPTLRRILLSSEELHKRARALQRHLVRALGERFQIALKTDVSRVGGGAFPQYDLPTCLVTLKPRGMSALDLKMALLATHPPVLGRLEVDAFCLDPRTLDAADNRLLVAALSEAWDKAHSAL
ncbi:MAG: L-seryl-tRNA(Sec) selenium transferase [Desulfovibrio sp.]|nr:L-seryl-tRNA(Sec) selenium transferase [Desulfovibrio sp.]